VDCIIVANIQYVLLDTIYYNNVQYNDITTTEEMINYDSNFKLLFSHSQSV